MLDFRIQYALHTTSYEEQPLSGKTLSRFRKRCYDYETLHNIALYHECVKDLSRSIAKLADYVNRNNADVLSDELRHYIEPDYSDSTEYELFIRCLSEQTIVENKERRLRTKEDGGMKSSMMQNSSDPEATFRSKAGREHWGICGKS